MTQPAAPLSTAAQVAVAVLAALGTFAGWYVLLTGGFQHTSGRGSSGLTTAVSGAPALAMATIMLVMAALGVAAILGARRASTTVYILGCGLVLVPPVLYVALG